MSTMDTPITSYTINRASDGALYPIASIAVPTTVIDKLDYSIIGDMLRPIIDRLARIVSDGDRLEVWERRSPSTGAAISYPVTGGSTGGANYGPQPPVVSIGLHL